MIAGDGHLITDLAHCLKNKIFVQGNCGGCSSVAKAIEIHDGAREAGVARPLCENVVRFDLMTNRLTSAAMAALIFLLVNLGASLFRSKSRFEAENDALRRQLIVLQRKMRKSSGSNGI